MKFLILGLVLLLAACGGGGDNAHPAVGGITSPLPLDFVINYEPWTPGQPGRKEVWLNQGSDNFVYGYLLDNVNTGNIIPFTYNGDQYCFFVGSGLYKRVNGKLILHKPVDGVSVVYRGSGGLYVLEEGWPYYTTRKL